MWTLQSTDPADADLVFRLLPGSLKTIGRAPGVDFVVDAALVSRVHCRLTLSDTNELLLEDLGSTNGTFVNGEKVPTAVLSDGDKVTVGRIEFVVNEAGGSSPRPLVCQVLQHERVRPPLAANGRLWPVPGVDD